MKEVPRVLHPGQSMELGIPPGEVRYLNERLTAKREQSLEKFLVTYFNGRIGPHQAQELLTTQDEIAEECIAHKAIAEAFFGHVNRAFPELENPYEYSPEEAQQIKQLYEQMRQRDKNGTTIESSNPFRSVCSLRYLSKKTHLAPNSIAKYNHNEIRLGSLSLKYYVEEPSSHSSVKEAIRVSVDGEDGRMRLQSARIGANHHRILSERRRVDIYPSVIKI